MTGSNKRKSTKKYSGSRIVALIVLVLVFSAIAGYFLFRKSTVAPPQTPVIVQDTQVLPDATVPKAAEPAAPVTTPPPKKTRDYSPPTTVHPTSDTPVVRGNGSARLAIIIDDMGSSISEARALAAIKVPLTFSIIPGLRVADEVASFAADKNIETMIHVPMQPKGWPAQRMEGNGLQVEMDDGRIQERVAAFIQQFSGAVGANNHMGSEFTEHEDKMGAALQPLKEHDLFFIDSMTSSGSVGSKVAQRLGIRSARRNVFLDNEQNRSYITGQLNQAVRLAKKSGSAIAICHPHTVTIATLAAVLPGLADQGISLVPASRLVK